MMAEQTHVYKSELGDDMKTFHNWCYDTLTEEELAIYEAAEMNEQYMVIYQKWWDDQKIYAHEVYEDGVKVLP